jgi:hypothetical protein
MLIWLCAPNSLVWGQAAEPEDAIVDAIREMPSISAADQTRMAEWVKSQLDKLIATSAEGQSTALARFVVRMQTQAGNPKNSPAFRTQLAAVTAQAAANECSKPNSNPTAAWGLTRVLVDMKVPETISGLSACLKASGSAARYLAARGLTEQRDAIGKDKAKLSEVIPAIQAAALAEPDAVVLSHLYRALAFPNQVGEVFNAYVAVLDKRLAARRKAPMLAADGAELEALEYFRGPGVAASLNQDQKVQLVQRVAVLLRLDAERYQVDSLAPPERVKLESELEAAEGVLLILTAGKTMGIADELAKGGHDRRADVLVQTHRWVGNAASNESGALNAAPWNVPIGAP